MMHTTRAFAIRDILSRDELLALAAKLTGGQTYVLCSAWRYEGLLLLNDATSEDGALELAIVRESDGFMLESLTASWMKCESFVEIIDGLVARRDTAQGYGASGWQRRTHPTTGASCSYCA